MVTEHRPNSNAAISPRQATSRGGNVTTMYTLVTTQQAVEGSPAFCRGPGGTYQPAQVRATGSASWCYVPEWGGECMGA
jgi:hypothetical protein